MRIAFILFLGLSMVTGMAKAQAPAAGAKTSSAPAAQQAPAATNDVGPGPLLDAAARIAQAVDSDQTGQLWDSGSAVAKKAVTRDSFMSATAKVRKPLGAATSRTWIAVYRQRSDGKSSPAGLYASVRFETVFAKGAKHELVSFRLDEDGVWRFTGYVLQQ